MSIRQYEHEDYDQVIKLFQILPELFTQRTIENIQQDLRDYELGDYRNVMDCFVSYRKKEILGAIICRQDYTGDRVFELKWLAVKQEKWYKGIGYHLMKHAEEILRNKARLIIFYTSNTLIWTNTKKFFVKLGYQQIAIIPDFWDDGDDRVVFWKRIQPIHKIID